MTGSLPSGRSPRPAPAHHGQHDGDVTGGISAVHSAVSRYAQATWDSVAAGPARPSRPDSWVRSQLPDAIGEQPELLEDVADRIERIWAGAGENWLHPARMAYVPATTSIAAVVGGVLAATRNSHVWPSNTAAVEWERATTDQLAAALGLAPSLTWAGGGAGVVLDSATAGVQQALLGALIRARGLDWRRHGVRGDERVYITSHTHGSVVRVALAAGPGDRGIRVVAHDPTTGAMCPTALSTALAGDIADGLCPVMVVATVGTTAAGAVDDLVAIGSICATRGLWLHADAAWLGSFALLPEHRNLLAGSGLASSVVISPQKLLRTGLGCSVLWTRWPKSIGAALAVDQPYLAAGVDGSGVDPRALQLPTGRPDRALVLDMTLRCLGLAEIRRLLRQNVTLVQQIEAWASGVPLIELRLGRGLGLACLRARSGDEATQALLDSVHAGGRVLLSPAEVDGRLWIRVAPAGTSDSAHTHLVISELTRALTVLRSPTQPNRPPRGTDRVLDLAAARRRAATSNPTSTDREPA